jgi:hypothetical protein
MLFLFRYKAEQKQEKQNDSQDTIAFSIVRKCIRLQSRLADYMQRKSDRLSDNVKKYSLISFCLLACGCSLYSIVESFRTPDNHAFSVAPIKVPEHATMTGEANRQPSIIITKDAFENVQRFRYYMDSLARNASGKRTHDSILAARSGLMDSVQIIEVIYNTIIDDGE